MNDKARGIDGGLLVCGMVLVCAGIAFLLDKLEVPDIGHLVRIYWPLLLVAFGLSKLFELPTVWFGLWMMAVGAWLQAVQLRWHGLTYLNSWPLVLMVLGGGIVLRTVIDPFLPRPGGRGLRENGSHEGTR